MYRFYLSQRWKTFWHSEKAVVTGPKWLAEFNKKITQSCYDNRNWTQLNDKKRPEPMWKYELSHHDCITATRASPFGPRRRNTNKETLCAQGHSGPSVPSILTWRRRKGPSRIRVHPVGYNGQREKIANRRRPLPSTKHLLGWVAISLTIITTTGPRCFTTHPSLELTGHWFSKTDWS